jgi:NADH-quinone oxidoreductase subunit L
VAIVQTDIKRVLAYSTISQLGYMMLGMGVGAWIAALFHLLTHAFFKALMFLGSGQVIEGCHHEQDMRNMGGLIRKMPVTAITFLVGVFAIAGVGIPAVWMPGHLPFGLGGYFSKDEILAVAWSRAYGQQHQVEKADCVNEGLEDAPTDPEDHAHPLTAVTAVAPGQRSSHAGAAPSIQNPKSKIQNSHLPAWLFWIPIAIAYVTPFYMLRAWWLTFMGKPRDEHVYAHAHESPLMYFPLVVLAFGTFFSSYLLFRPMVAAAAPAPFLTALYDGEAAQAAEAHGALIDHQAHKALAPIVGFAFVLGFVAAWLIYRNGLAVAQRLATALRPLHTVLVHKFYFDELYGLLLVGGTMTLKTICYAFDKYVIDGLVDLSAWITERLSRFSGVVLDAGVVDGAVNGVGRGTLQLGSLVRRPQVGRIRNYVLFAAGGVTALVLWMAFA